MVRQSSTFVVVCPSDWSDLSLCYNDSRKLIHSKHLNPTILIWLRYQAYDYLLTLPYEIKYMWTQKWSLIKVLFFLTRYPVFFDTVCAIYCESTRASSQRYTSHLFAVQLGHNLSAEVCHALYSATGCTLFISFETSYKRWFCVRAHHIWDRRCGRFAFLFRQVSTVRQLVDFKRHHHHEDVGYLGSAKIHRNLPHLLVHRVSYHCMCLSGFVWKVHPLWVPIHSSSERLGVHSDTLDPSCSDLNSRPSVDRQGLPCRPCKYRCCRNLC